MIYEFNGHKPVVDESSFIHELAAVTGNVIIGKNATVGANSLVNCDIPPNEIWVGSPAKKLK